MAISEGACAAGGPPVHKGQPGAPARAWPCFGTCFPRFWPSPRRVGGIGRCRVRPPRQNEQHGRRQGRSVHTSARRHGILPAEGRAAAGNRPADVPRSAVCGRPGGACGFRDGRKPLHVREWACGECGIVHDRDHNAARNVLFEGRRIVAAGRAETPNACGAPVRRAHLPAQRGEAGSTRKGRTAQAGIPGL
ncbi:zinc ribbon domain-containing protein [Streptomyces sp. Tue6028]|uniref:zinc ribbon domain-containing protein n=1 Tax=Streptomyces sp. Tue6028 TaxID=2036037 RepID=UPI003D70687D